MVEVHRRSHGGKAGRDAGSGATPSEHIADDVVDVDRIPVRWIRAKADVRDEVKVFVVTDEISPTFGAAVEQGRSSWVGIEVAENNVARAIGRRFTVEVDKHLLDLGDATVRVVRRESRTPVDGHNRHLSAARKIEGAAPEPRTTAAIWDRNTIEVVVAKVVGTAAERSKASFDRGALIGFPKVARDLIVRAEDTLGNRQCPFRPIGANESRMKFRGDGRTFSGVKNLLKRNDVGL